jgi:hypothetical protein
MNLTHALIVPDFGDRQDERYQMVGSLFKEQGIEPAFMPIDWHRAVLTRNIAQFSNYYDRYDRRTTVIFGYALGAMISFVQSSIRPPAALILASLESWFAEDIPLRSKTDVAALGLRRLADFESFDFDALVKFIVSPTYVLIGKSEASRIPSMRLRAEAVSKKVKDSKLLMLPGVKRDLASPVYREALRNVITELAS